MDMSPGAQRGLMDLPAAATKLARAVEELTKELKRANDHYERDMREAGPQEESGTERTPRKNPRRRNA